MDRYVKLVFYLTICCYKGSTEDQVNLTVSPILVTEHDPQTFICKYNGDENIIAVGWKEGDKTFAKFRVENGVCTKFQEPDYTLYSHNCSVSTNTYMLTIKTVTRQNTTSSWLCDIFIKGTSISSPSNSVSPKIKVPITSVSMTEPQVDTAVPVHENTAAGFTCVTSGGLPEPSVRWYKDSKTQNSKLDDVDITSGATSTSKKLTDGLIATTSKLKYMPTRNDNGMRIYCTANIEGQSPLNSTRQPQLNVQYPPDKPPVISDYTSEYRVIAKTKGQLICSVSGGNPVANLTWSCFTNGEVENSRTDTVTTSKVTWAAQQGQDKTCVCKSSHFNWSADVSVVVKVLYPPSKPTLWISSTSVSGTVNVIRNNTLSVTCSSSGNPSPSYRWTHLSNNISRVPLLYVSSVQNDGTYTCRVQNVMNPSQGNPVTSSNLMAIVVHMLYAPSVPTFNYQTVNGPNIPAELLTVIKGDSFKVACTSNGEPAPYYNWDNLGNNRILTVNNITTDHSSICKARNMMEETVGQQVSRSATATLQINVLYPPGVVTLKYHYGNSSVADITTILSIREGNPLMVTCSSSSKPPPAYTWTGTVSSSSATLKANSVLRSQTGKITCNIENAMTRTFANPDETVVGRTSRSFNLQVLYPPRIGELKNKSVAEGSAVTVSCPVTAGYPTQTTYEWIRNGTLWKRTQTFAIDTTSRNDAMIYTCKVSNRMKQTGEQPVFQPDTKAFYMNVLYSASVKKFFITGHEEETSIVMNETVPVQFECNVDSNPGSNISVYYQENVLESQKDTKSLAYSIASAKCTDRGEYSCVGFNQYNGNHSAKYLSLFVNCSPRPSASMTLKQNVTSAQHKPAVLTFTTLAYPEPKSDDFKWYRLESKGWQLLSNNGEFQIVTSNLQTNLTIKKVNRTYYGMYKLEISNTVGIYSQPFYLEPEDIPDPPKEFHQVAELVTESSITLQWKPGFDNGPDQTFILRYKKVSDNDWTSVSIPDTGEEVMTHNITKLSSGTEYEVVLHATNELGNSSETETLKIKTIAKDIPSSPNLGLILGVVFGGVAVLGFLGFLLVRKLRNGKAKKKSEVELNGRNMDDQNEDSSDDEVVTENAMYESASNVGQKKLVDDNVYAKPQKKSAANTDVYAVVNKTKKQDKKKKQKSQQKKAYKGDIYENAPDTAVDKDKTYANSAYEENPYETPDQASARGPKKNADGLIYADLTFNDQPKGQKKLVIHGLDSMTEYVEVDFTKKADPLPDSDTEDQK